MPSGSHDINVRVLALIGVISAILVYALIVATQAWFRYEFARENERKYVNVPFAELEQLKQAQLQELQVDPHPVSPDQPDTWVIPIDRAMQEVVKQYGKQQ